MPKSIRCQFSFVALFVAVFVAMPAVASAQDASEVTFTKDIASILQRSCQDCHRTGSIAPMSLLTYEEARPWARSIKDKVVTRAMPPWYIAVSYTHLTLPTNREV